MISIIPSILTNDPLEAIELLKRCEGVARSTGSGLIDRVSIDIIDGKFAENKTVFPDLFADIETDLKIDYQLMVEEPVSWIARCVRGQADRIIGHIEKMRDQVEFLGKVQEVGAGVGLALDLPTPVSELDQTILNNLDVVLVMSVEAGFGGQKFSDEAIKKIERLSEIRERDKTPYRIQDDGGVTLEKIDDAHFTGADEVSIGRLLFKGDLADNINKFQIAAHSVEVKK